MSFDAALRHVAPRPGSPPAAAAASRPGGGVGVALGFSALAALVVQLVRGARDEGERLDAYGDVDQEPERSAEERDVIDTTGELVEVCEAVAPAPPAEPPEVVHIREAATWGTALTVAHNPPRWVLDPHVWERAKSAVRPRWYEYPRPWAVVAHVYHAMGGRMAA
jgi:hypothetical protein